MSHHAHARETVLRVLEERGASGVTVKDLRALVPHISRDTWKNVLYVLRTGGTVRAELDAPRGAVGGRAYRYFAADADVPPPEGTRWVHPYSLEAKRARHRRAHGTRA